MVDHKVSSCLPLGSAVARGTYITSPSVKLTVPSIETVETPLESSGLLSCSRLFENEPIVVLDDISGGSEPVAEVTAVTALLVILRIRNSDLMLSTYALIEVLLRCLNNDHDASVRN